MYRVRNFWLIAGFAVASLFGAGAAFAECGMASYYHEGSMTASGERYNHMGVSAAHRTLPFGSRVVVTNQHTGRSITVRINDRGPFIGGRIIDLSTGAKNALGMGGLAPVCIQVASYGSGGRIASRTSGKRIRMAKAGGHRYARTGHPVKVAYRGGRLKVALALKKRRASEDDS